MESHASISPSVSIFHTSGQIVFKNSQISQQIWPPVAIGDFYISEAHVFFFKTMFS